MSDNHTPPDFRDLVWAFARIGMLSFGGPAGQIALMHRDLVEDRGWITDRDYLHALNFCHLLPGPEAQQLATWVGWRLHGWRGGLAAGLLFIIPGAVVILLLSMIYAVAANLDWFAAVFLGVKAAVLAIVLQALLRIGRRALDTRFKQALAIAAFIALFLFRVPFPIIVAMAALLGFLAAAIRPAWLGATVEAGYSSSGARPWRSTIGAVAVWGAIWSAPMIAIAAALGSDHVLWEIGAFFSKLAVVTFGGAYAVLAYMAQEAVEGLGWLRPGEMADGLGLAETTPGPLIMVTQFVGYLAAYRAPEPFTPLVAGLLGAALTTWVTFAPCFLWIFAIAPWIDRMGGAVRLKGALAAITAAVVGVIANLSVWFALHVLFATVGETSFGPIRVDAPDWFSFHWQAAVLTAGACILLFAASSSVLYVLAVCAIGGLLLGA